MGEEPRVLAYGTYADSPRTVDGLNVQLTGVGFNRKEIAQILRGHGLPTTMPDDPDFSLSPDLELDLLNHAVRRIKAQQLDLVTYAIKAFAAAGVNIYGVLGLALHHAPSLLVATRELLEHPELTWGHSRIVLIETGDELKLQFEMATFPNHFDRQTMSDLTTWCVLRDLASIARVLWDISGKQVRPIEIRLSYPQPDGDFNASEHMGCPVMFDASECAVIYTSEQMNSATEFANATQFKRYQRLTGRLAGIVAPEPSLSGQVSRILWACSTPPGREEVAGMLGMGDRTLARRLVDEDCCFRELVAQVSCDRARNYLSYSDMSIAQIADFMGYSDASGFNRAFRTWTGVAPSQWREKTTTSNGQPRKDPRHVRKTTGPADPHPE